MVASLEGRSGRCDPLPTVPGWRWVTERGVPLSAMRSGGAYRLGGRRFPLGRGEAQVDVAPDSTPLGTQPVMALRFPPDVNGLAVTLRLALWAEGRGLIWSWELAHGGVHPLQLERLDWLHAVVAPAGEWDFFANGWQSWSYSGLTPHGRAQPRSRLGAIRAPLDPPAASAPRGRDRLRASMFAALIHPASRSALLAGFLSQREHFGIIDCDRRPDAPRLHLWADGEEAILLPGATLRCDWAILEQLDLDAPDPLGPYLEAVGQLHQVRLPAAPPSGWCSWYYFMDNYVGQFSAADLRQNLAAMAARQAELPLRTFQIDDGYEPWVGDWDRFRPALPDGVAPLAAAARAADFEAGLWLAPFILDPRSATAAAHPDWLLRDPRGRPVNAGFLWNRFAQALDLTHPAAQDFAQTAVARAVSWGFRYLKLDFLYAAALSGRRHDPTYTGARALRHGLEGLRAAVGPEVCLLGCGCPLGSAIGLVDAMRISADTAVTWRPQFRGIRPLFQEEPDLPAAGLAAHNTLTRAALHRRWWWNDPDCLLLRPDTDLTLDEVQLIATGIALSGGSLFVSDHLPSLPEERLRLLERLLPPIGQRPTVLDLLHAAQPRRVRLDLDGPAGPWSLVGLYNWGTEARWTALRPEDWGLAPGRCWAQEFWRGWGGWAAEGGLPLAPHSAALFAIRAITPDQPAYLGSDLHISQGLEVRAWAAQPGRLKLRLERPGRIRGQVWLYLPGALRAASSAAGPLPWEARADGVVRLNLDLPAAADIQLAYGPASS
jgi:alpha-galactosidase